MENIITIINQNLWLHPQEFNFRMQKFLSQTLNPDLKPKQPTKPSILTIQEVFSPSWKKQLVSTLERANYATFSANYIHHDYKWYSYLPSLIIFSMTVLTDITFVKFLIAFFALFFLPQVFKFLALHLTILPSDPSNQKEKLKDYDYQGQVLGLSKSEFHNFKILESKPFDTVGYPLPTYPCNLQKPKNKQANNTQLFLEFLFNLLFYYIQMIFMKPGYMIVQCEHIKTGKRMAIAVCHFVVKFENPKRIHQVIELNNVIEKLNSKNNFDHVLVAGDFNTYKQYVDVQYLLSKNFVDASEVLDEKGNIVNKIENLPDNQKYTWHNTNRYTQTQNHLENDAKIDHILFKDFNQKSQLKTVEAFNVNNTPETIISDHYGIYSKLKLTCK